jgi:hypothetical protein
MAGDIFITVLFLLSIATVLGTIAWGGWPDAEEQAASKPKPEPKPARSLEQVRA